jgi:DNA-binding transcriptional MocR family regulator
MPSGLHKRDMTVGESPEPMRDAGNDRDPAYQRIQAEICQQIRSGQLRPGDPVGSERQPARLHNVSLMTARHALTKLAEAGVVDRTQGKGTFVALRMSSAECGLLSRPGREIVYLGACLIAGLRLARERHVNDGTEPTNRSIEKSLALALQIFQSVSRKTSRKANHL